MSSERDFDRLARAWLDLGPDEAPDRAVAAVLAAAESTPQVRRSPLWPIWRFVSMSPISRAVGTALAVLAILVIGGGIFLGQQDRPGVGGPMTSPSASPAPSLEPSPSAPAASAPGIVLQRAPTNLGCDSIGGPRYRSVTLRIDPEADVKLEIPVATGDDLALQPTLVDVWAEPEWDPESLEPGESGAPRIPVYWTTGFNATGGETPVVRGPRGEEVARDGVRIDMAEGAYPPLADYFLCTAPSGLWILEYRPE